MLPVTVTPAISVANFSTAGMANYTSFSGKPENTTARPITQKITVKDAFSKELPPYSFIVIRIKPNKP
jgi:hypothetical protein